MAWTTLCYGKQDMPFNYCEFICDSKDDITNLPTNKRASNLGQIEFTCAIGSKAIIVEDGSTYILNNQNSWIYWKRNDVLKLEDGYEQNVEWAEPASTYQTFSVYTSNTQGSNLDKFIKSIRIPEGIVALESSCFANFQLLENVRLPNSLQVIKTGVFAGCKALKSINLHIEFMELPTENEEHLS